MSSALASLCLKDADNQRVATAMKLVILNEFFYPDHFGGTGKVLSDLARKLHDNHGWEIETVATARSYRNNDRTLETSDNWDGIKITRIMAAKSRVSDLSKRLKSELSLTYQTFKTIKNIECDAVIVSTAPAVLPFAAYFLKKLKKVPYFYIIYDLEPDRAVVMNVAAPDSWKTKLLSKSQTNWLMNADKVVAIGRCLKSHLEKNYKLPEGKVEVIVVGESADDVKALPYESPEQFIVLYSGNFGRYHDFNPILDAAEILQENPKFKFILCGGGKKKNEVAEDVITRGLKNVEVKDFVPVEEYESMLASASVSLVTLEAGMEGLCVPSKFYSILASGRPAVALVEDSCEIAMALKENQCGISVPNANGEKLADVLKKLQADPELVECMGLRARKALETKYSSAMVAKAFDQMIREGIKK